MIIFNNMLFMLAGCANKSNIADAKILESSILEKHKAGLLTTAEKDALCSVVKIIKERA